MEKIRLGIVGLGQRGAGLLGSYLEMKDVEVTALCDNYRDKAETAAERVYGAYGKNPYIAENYKELVSRGDVDAVLICCSWEDHVPVAKASMRAGKYTALEVGGAYSINDCWELVRCQEETGTHLIMMENCCYGRREMLVLNMVKKGLFGEIVHCEGAYSHDLRQEVLDGDKIRHYRLRNYIGRNCDNYPTHQLGPICKILNINHGNRMMTLTSMASKAVGIRQYIKDNMPDDFYLKDTVFNQGDVITTNIKCANGETITLILDTNLPGCYSRRFKVLGTLGRYNEENGSVFLASDHEKYHEFANWQEQWGNDEAYKQKFDHPVWKEFRENIQGGHGGMDWLVGRAFIECAKRNIHPPMDVYDAAAWMCISTLSEDSIALGSAPVAIPDFTNGKWLKRNAFPEHKYSLHDIIIDDDMKLFFED